MALVAKINDIVNGNFEECHGYEHYLETELMEKFQLKYNNTNDGLKGCIVWMVVRKQINLAKSIKCRGEANHTHKILKKRTNEEIKKFGRRKVKVEK